MVCLSVAGSFVAGVHYFAVDLPDQNTVQAPRNTCPYPGGWNVYHFNSAVTVTCYCNRDCCYTRADMEKCYSTYHE
jgi:hypothetical protein